MAHLKGSLKLQESSLWTIETTSLYRNYIFFLGSPSLLDVESPLPHEGSSLWFMAWG